jgi:uncharacterized protein YbjT (DUF2867 family)
MNKSAVVFGATGLVGKELIFELLEHSDFLSVKAIVRNTLPFSNPKLEQVIAADFTRLDQQSGSLAADVFFCCVGTTIKKAGSQDAFRKVDLEIPLAVARMAESLHVPNLVIISSIGANEQSSNFYLRTKGEMEQQVKAVYHGNLKIVRPSFLMGNRAEFRLGEKIGIYIAKALGIVMIGPLRKYKGIQAWDAARAMIQSIELPKERQIIESDELHLLAKSAKKGNN